MRVVVTAAGSDLGQQLLRAIAARGSLRRGGGAPQAIDRILAVDHAQPAALFIDERVEYVRGDYEQPRFLSRMMGAACDSVFHLAPRYAALGAGPGADGLELALARSVQVTQSLIDACRLLSCAPRFVYAGLRGLRSTPGAVPQDMGAVCVDVCESVLFEAARRGIVSLCSVRLPSAAGQAPSAAELEAAARALLDAHDLEAPNAMPRIVEAEVSGRLRACTDA
jgi:hypothetical protein